MMKRKEFHMCDMINWRVRDRLLAKSSVGFLFYYAFVEGMFWILLLRLFFPALKYEEIYLDESFCWYIEVLVVSSFSSGTFQLQYDELMDYNTRFHFRTVLKESDCLKMITEVAVSEVPHYGVRQAGHSVRACTIFARWTYCSLAMCYEHIKPRGKKLLQILVS